MSTRGNIHRTLGLVFNSKSLDDDVAFPVLVTMEVSLLPASVSTALVVGECWCVQDSCKIFRASPHSVFVSFRNLLQSHFKLIEEIEFSEQAC
jgi:hypothetical protein